jgi:hypothetical protein
LNQISGKCGARNAGLATSGTQAVADADIADTVSSAVQSVIASSTTTGLGLTKAQLLSMLSVTPTSGLAADPGSVKASSCPLNSNLR